MRALKALLALAVVCFVLVAGASDTAACTSNSDCKLTCNSNHVCTCSSNSDCAYGERCAGSECIQAICGDGVLDIGEQCDDGAANSDVAPDACRTDCRHAYCDDGVTDTGEQCDDGSSNSDYAPNTCRANCKLPRCGDGVVDSAYGEECDEGSGNSNAAGSTCSTSCIIPGCGNGALETGEICDDGNTSDHDGCTSHCRNNVCGDGYTWTGVEACEYDHPWSPGDCRYDCGEDASLCGNGIVDQGEACDDGVDRNSDEPIKLSPPEVTCRTDCQRPRCGDGILDVGEDCDLEPDCQPDCTWPAPR